MSIESIRQEVYEANMDLVTKELVISTWGNVSGYDPEDDMMLIKPSGVPYTELRPEMLVPVDMTGKVIGSDYNPSSDTLTHIELYKAFRDSGIRGIVHTHSQFATMWAQMGKDIPCYGTTHCDYFYGNIPCTRDLTVEEIDGGYEINTGKVILEEFRERNCVEMQAVLVHSHAPFTWGKSPMQAVLHAQVLEYVAKMAIFNYIATDGKNPLVADAIRNKHYSRKFGPNAYYGQKKKD